MPGLLDYGGGSAGLLASGIEPWQMAVLGMMQGAAQAGRPGTNWATALAGGLAGGAGGLLAGREDARRRTVAQQALADAPEGERAAYGLLSAEQLPGALLQREQRERDKRETAAILGGLLGGAPRGGGLLNGAGGAGAGLGGPGSGVQQAPLPPVAAPGGSATVGSSGQVAGLGVQIPPELLPHFQRASAETGVPLPLLAAVARQESNFGQVPDRAGDGRGVMQVLPSTARAPGYGVAPADPMQLATDPAANILFGARYLAGRGQAAGVTDWSDPQQRAAGLAAYNGGGDPNYVQNVTRYLPGGPAPAGAGAAAPGAAPAAAPGAGAAGAGLLDPLRYQQAVLAAGNNPRALAALQLLAPMVRQQGKLEKLSAGDTLLDPLTGRVVASLPKEDTRAPVVVADPASPFGFRYAPAGDAARQGLAAPLPEGARPPAGYRWTRGEDGQQRLEPIPGGQPAQQAEQQPLQQATKLREEMQALPVVKEFSQVLPQIEAIRRAAPINTKAADLDIVFAFAKMLDPTSVVREGEADSVVRTGGIFDVLRGYAEGIQGGARLTSAIRADLMRQAESRFGIYADQYDNLVDRYRRLATSYGADPDLVGTLAPRPDKPGQPQYRQPPPGAGGAAADPAAAAAAAPPPDGGEAAPGAPLTRNRVSMATQQQLTEWAAQPNLSAADKALLAAELNRRAQRLGGGTP